MSKFAIPIIKETLDLIELLNDGVRPMIEEKPTTFIFEISTQNEISDKIEHTFMLFGDKPPQKLQILKL